MMLIHRKCGSAFCAILAGMAISLLPSCASTQQEGSSNLAYSMDSLRIGERYKYFGDYSFGMLSGYGNKVRALVQYVSLSRDSIVIEGKAVDGEMGRPLHGVTVYLGHDRMYRANVSKPDGSYAGGMGLYRIEPKDSSQTDADGSFVIRASILSSSKLYFVKSTYFMDIYEIGKILRDKPASKNNP
jgi:hypothetical protein